MSNASIASVPTIPTLTKNQPGKAIALAACFLVVSVLLSVALVSVRNTYDDEYSNLRYVDMSIPQVIHAANSADVHPPGMYLLSNFAYRAIPSPRWMTLFDVVFLYAGVATFLFAITPLFPTLRTQVCFLLLASLNPQLLMWGTTIRWYGWWTGVALITLVIALRPGAGQRPALSYGRAVVLGVSLACLFYINYITLVFGLALGATMLFRYGRQAWKQYLVTLALFTPLIVPQLHAFLKVHIPGGGNQRASFVLSFARLVQGLFCSEAYLPWHPLAIAAFILFAGLLVYGLVRAYQLGRSSGLSSALLTEHKGLAGIVLFSVCFFVLVWVAGFGIKPRNGLLLAPTLAVVFALIIGSVRSSRLQAIVLLVLAAWCGVGNWHLIRREGLSKSNMNNRPEELTRYIEKNQGADCVAVVTYDSLMSLTTSTSGLKRTLVLSPELSALPLHDKPFALGSCQAIDLYRVRSYLGGLGDWGKSMNAEMLKADVPSTQPEQQLRLSFDPEAARKRKLTFMSGASDLPDYRYLVTVDRISPAEFENVERQLPDYAPSDGQPKPMLAAAPPKAN
jgi:hypothetical protein